jgi:hypothetical protein
MMETTEARGADPLLRQLLPNSETWNGESQAERQNQETCAVLPSEFSQALSHSPAEPATAQKW